MTKETKVGLLIGLGIILLIGIVVSDHLSKSNEQDPAPLSNWAPAVSESINPGGDPFAEQSQSTTSDTRRNGPIPLPDELQSPTPAPQRRNPATQAQPQRPNSTRDAMATNQFDRTLIDPVIEQPISNSGMATGPTTIPDPPHALRAGTRQIDNAKIQEEKEDSLQPILHYVRTGETLYQIANLYFGSDDYWIYIQAANPKLVTRDGQIQAGTRLRIPPEDGLKPLNGNRSGLIRQATIVQPREKTITVMTGDTLSGLASKHLGGASRWPELLKANRDQLRTPEQLREGMKLRIPADQNAQAVTPTATERSSNRTVAKSSKYTVRSGDTLSSIAGQFLGSQRNWDKLYEANRKLLKSPDDLQVGMELIIP